MACRGDLFNTHLMYPDVHYTKSLESKNSFHFISFILKILFGFKNVFLGIILGDFLYELVNVVANHRFSFIIVTKS